MYFPLTAVNAKMSTGVGWWIWALQTPAKTWGEEREGAEQVHLMVSLCHFILRCIYTTHNMGNGQPCRISRAGITGRKAKKISLGKLHQMVCIPLSFPLKVNLLTWAQIQQERWPWHYFSSWDCNSQNQCQAHYLGLTKGRCSPSAYAFSERYVGLTAGWNKSYFLTLNLLFCQGMNSSQ